MKRIGLRYLDSYGHSERDVALRDSFVFLIVRHPMERLVYAWKDKFIDKSAVTLWRKKLAKTDFG